MVQIPVVNKVLAICSLLIQLTLWAGKIPLHPQYMQGEMQTETELWHSRDWTPHSHVSTQPILPIYALIIFLSLSTQVFTWKQCDVSCVPAKDGARTSQGAELLETISSAPGCIATFSHSCGSNWRQFLKNHQKQHRKSSLTFEPRQFGGIVIVQKKGVVN